MGGQSCRFLGEMGLKLIPKPGKAEKYGVKYLELLLFVAVFLTAAQASAEDRPTYDDDLLKYGLSDPSKEIDQEKKLDVPKVDLEQVKDGAVFEELDGLTLELEEETLNSEQLAENQGLKYGRQNYDLIDWKKLNVEYWGDLATWKSERELKDQYPRWKVAFKQRALVELVGRFVDCVGECLSFRADGHAHMQYRSAIMEGDEIQTGKDSYAWIFLMDGTLVRLSPNTSISFKEINISSDRFLFHARLNYGNMLWMSRFRDKVEANNDRETDSLFLPLAYYEVNPPSRIQMPKEDDLYAFLIEDNTNLGQYIRLNNLLEENNKLMAQKRSTVFLTMPNGSLMAESPMVEMVALERGKSYLKNRSFKMYNPEAAPEQKATFFFRGLLNREESEVALDTWYEVDADGRSISPYDAADLNFSFGEYLTKRIPSLMLAREMMIKDYSLPLFDPKIDEVKLAGETYRMWNGPNKLADDEIQKRLDFLKEYTRREETTLQGVARLFNERLKERGDELPTTVYSDEFFARAVNHFIMTGNKRKAVSNDREALNSTKKRFWEMIHSKKGI